MKYLIPFIDNIEFVVLALSLVRHASNDVLFVIVREDKNAKRDDRFVKASVTIQETAKLSGATANFFYTNIERELFDLNNKTKVTVNAGMVVNAIIHSMAVDSEREILTPYSISDYYLCSHMLNGYAKFRKLTKSDIYNTAEAFKLPLDLLNEYRQLDLQRIEGLGLTHQNIEWADRELKNDGWTANLDNDYTEQQREYLQFARKRKYEI